MFVDAVVAVSEAVDIDREDCLRMIPGDSPQGVNSAAGETVSLILVRHGRTALNAAGLLRGRLDPELDSIGVEQVQAVAMALKAYRPGLVVSSPLRRTVQTAEAIAAASGVGLVIEGDLIDRDYGPWAGHHPDEAREQFGSVERAPGVESWAWLSQRAVRALERSYPVAPVVLVTHEVVLQAMLEHLDPAHPRPRQDPACWNVVSLDAAGRLRVSAVNLHAPTGV